MNPRKRGKKGFKEVCSVKEKQGLESDITISKVLKFFAAETSCEVGILVDGGVEFGAERAGRNLKYPSGVYGVCRGRRRWGGRWGCRFVVGARNGEKG